MPHPVSCASPAGAEKPHLFITAKEYDAMSIDEIEAQHAATPIAFSLNPTETAKALAWRDEHDKRHTGGGAIGGRYTFSFTPTTLGTVAKVIWAWGVAYFGRSAYSVALDQPEKTSTSPLTVGHGWPTVRGWR